MGYAFIEYKYKEVAKIAADSMNGYMFYGKKLVCRVLEDDEGVKVRTKKFRFIPHNKKFVEERNRVNCSLSIFSNKLFLVKRTTRIKEGSWSSFKE